MARPPSCVGDLALPPAGADLSVAPTVAVPFDLPDGSASLHLRLRAIRRRRLGYRLSNAGVAGAWLGFVTLLLMVGGGLLNTR